GLCLQSDRQSIRVGGFDKFYSRRINIKHRLVYKVHQDEKIVAILSMWSHYEF
ncbi:MAG: type II toxin-antitoxin system YoeB family toxin, partial [Oscillospiraceae bacterium]